MTPQAKELLARMKLNEMLSEKGRKLIWGVHSKHDETSGTVYTWEAQCFPSLCYKLQTTVYTSQSRAGGLLWQKKK